MELATTLTAFLAPFLPSLLKLGQPVAESAGKALGAKLGAGTWEKAKEIWVKLRPGVESKRLAQVSAEELAENKEDAEARDVFSAQLKKLLQENPALASEIQQSLEENPEAVSKAVNITQTVKGDRNIVIGQSDGNLNIQQS
ncbi:MAG: hypothetical protein F6K04_12575 [Leptolyngbya sp. SIO4C5]|nr:hypothetical protein [Leptolyngbya sp. SIO4C5]